MWGNEGLKVAFIKKPNVTWVGLVLITDKQNGTKKTYCNPTQKKNGNRGLLASHGIF